MKIFWAFNPFDKDKKLRNTGKSILNAFFKKEDQVQAIYVASNAEVNVATAYHLPKEKRYTDYPRKLIKKDLTDLGIKKIGIEVIPSLSFSLSSTVKLFAAFAKNNNADLILVATNARSLIPRMVFGSFAESLVHLSMSDLLIYHQKTKVGLNPPRKILYAHDFSTKGNLGLLRITEYAKKWNSTLIIVHIVRPDFNLENGQGKLSNSYRQDVLNQVKKIEESLKKQEINVAIYLEASLESASSVILKIAKNTKSDIVALTAKSGNLTALLGGSITRQVLRESTLLTLVLKV
ncbi:MAG: hypothetical protein EHM20_08250 [Alphaproteobacteria bacterium]|nr:MAG: hypothetical protein EHM20_08250 [Alphaproteobacteria bacterium]